MGADDSKTTAMPPGMVMGPDGKPCKICTAFRHWKPGGTPTAATTSKSSGSDNSQKNGTGHSTAAGMMAALASASSTTTTTPSRPDAPPPNCPPDVEQLGRATWTFLHTTAAYYPERPTPTQRANMLALLRALPVVYPCAPCAADFDDDLKENPPDVSGRVGLSRWLCERHNEVNGKLGKEKFDCARTDERWKDGPADGRCD